MPISLFGSRTRLELGGDNRAASSNPTHRKLGHKCLEDGITDGPSSIYSVNRSIDAEPPSDDKLADSYQKAKVPESKTPRKG